MSAAPSAGFRRLCLAMALIATSWSLPGSVWADAYPLQEVKNIVDTLKPNILIVLETAESMQGLPAENPARYNQVGVDCEDGNRYCRLVGQSGRRLFSGMGRNGMFFGVPPTTCTQTATYEYVDTRTKVDMTTATQTTTDTQSWDQISTGSGTGTATATGTGTAADTATVTGSGSANVTGTVTGTWTVSGTVTPSSTGVTTGGRTVTVTATAVGTGTTTHSMTYNNSGVLTLTKTATAYGTVTQSGTVSGTKTATASANKTVSTTKTATATGTGTVGVTGTATVSVTATVTGTPTLTKTLTISATGTGTGQTTVQATGTATGTQTVVTNQTETVSKGLTVTGTVTGTVSGTGTVTGSASVTATGQNTGNQTKTATAVVTATATANATGVGTGTGYNQWFTFTGAITSTNTQTVDWIAATNYNRTVNGQRDIQGYATVSLVGVVATCTNLVYGTQTYTVTRTVNATCGGNGTAPSTGTAYVPANQNTGSGTHIATGICTGGVNSDVGFTTGSGTASATLSRTTTVTGTGTVSVTASVTASNSGTATASRTVSGTSTATASSTAGGSGTVTATKTLTATGTVTATPTATGSATFGGTYPGTASVTAVGTETYMTTGTHVVSTCGFEGGQDLTRCDDPPSTPTTSGYCDQEDSTSCSSASSCSSLPGDFCRYIAASDNPGHTREEACMTTSPSPWGSCKRGRTTENVTCNSYTDSSCNTTVPGDFCAEGQPAKMCRDSGLWCKDNYDCPGTGDACEHATSRMMTVKRALRRAITDYTDKVSFGFMSTYQGKGVFSTDTDANTAIYPYVKLTTCPPSVSARETKLLTRGELEKAGCFTVTGGPSGTCTIDYGGNGALNNEDPALNRIAYTLTTYNDGDSRWLIPRTDGSGKYMRKDASYLSSCGSSKILPACAFSPVTEGTGQYEGSYYYFDYPQGTPIADTGTPNEGSLLHPKYFSKYKGKYYNAGGGNCYNAMDAARSDIVNDGVFGRTPYALAVAATSPYTVTGTGTATGVGIDTSKEVSVPVPWSGAAGGTTCSGQDGALYTPAAVPFLTDTTFGGQSLTRDQKALMMTARLEKASFGGVGATGATAPIGCALNPGAPNQYTNAAGYLAEVRSRDAANNGTHAPCWTNNIILVVDGHSNGPGDQGEGLDCASTQCAYNKDSNPDLSSCQCKAITDALSLAQSGIRTHVVANVPANWLDGAGSWAYPYKYPYTYAFLWNLAIAGSAPDFSGTPSFGTSEAEVYKAISDKIMAAAYAFVYTTTAPVPGGTTMDPTTRVLNPSRLLFDTSVNYPYWQGNIRAYNTTPDLVWSATKVANAGHPGWKARRVYFSDKDGVVRKVIIDANTGAISDTTAGYLDDPGGLGAAGNTEEAKRIMQWLLGKPELGNPAPLMGAITSSTPIVVGQANITGQSGSETYSAATWKRPQLLYVGADDGMLHAFFAPASITAPNSITPFQIGSDTFYAGEEAFAFIPWDMMPVITKLYVQGGQNLSADQRVDGTTNSTKAYQNLLADKGQHIFGLAGSPKVKDMCLSTSCGSDGSGWRTVLVMTEGPGGNRPFALDITNVVTEDAFNGLATDNVASDSLLWSAASLDTDGKWDRALGQTTSVPAFYYRSALTAAPNRVLFASGYPTRPRADSGYGSQGLVLLDVDAKTGDWDQTLPHTLGTTGASSCTSAPRQQQRAILADIALARDWSSLGTSQNLLGAYVVDTWGNTFQYVPGLDVVPHLYTRGCGQPLHFSPAVVQLDKLQTGALSAQHRIYLVQVTNSNLDPETRTYTDASGPYPGSELVVTKLAWSGIDGDAPTIDASYDGDGHIVLATDASDMANRICLSATTFTKTKADDCSGTDGYLPATARPVGTPNVIMRSDGLGFQVITGWYDWTAHSNDCSSAPNFNYGTSYVTVHEFGADATWYQLAGFTMTDTVLTGGTFVGTGFFLDGIMGANEGVPQGYSFGQSIVSLQQLLNAAGLERYSRTSWTERME